MSEDVKDNITGHLTEKRRRVATLTTCPVLPRPLRHASFPGYFGSSLRGPRNRCGDLVTTLTPKGVSFSGNARRNRPRCYVWLIVANPGFSQACCSPALAQAGRVCNRLPQLPANGHIRESANAHSRKPSRPESIKKPGPKNPGTCP